MTYLQYHFNVTIYNKDNCKNKKIKNYYFHKNNLLKQ